MKQIGKGAEAIICLDGDCVLKNRLKKSYRHSEIDKRLRKSRTKREAKVLSKLQELNFPGPKLNSFCDKEMNITMEFLEGDKLRDVLEKNPKEYSFEIGKKLALLHNKDIIHGDLTTSNILLKEEIYFIDFGLSFFSNKTEDKAVDLHLLDRALESKHYKIHKICIESALDGYKKHCDDPDVIKRLEKVKQRGRNKSK
jgi:TP53 regulating kinase-like protein